MYWYKVKMLLIYMFAAINIFLICFIIQGKVRQNLYDMQEINSLMSVLESNKITVAEGIVSKKETEVKTAIIENLILSGEETAKIMLGENYTKETDENGKEYFVSGAKKISTANGVLSYSDASLVPDENLSEDKISKAVQLLKEYGINTENAVGKINGGKIIFTYYFDGRKLFENTLYVKLSGDKICEAGGKLIAFEEKGKTRVRSTADALLMFLRDKNRPDGETKIISAELGYSVLMADTGINFKMTETIPFYKITTDQNKIFYYEAKQ